MFIQKMSKKLNSTNYVLYYTALLNYAVIIQQKLYAIKSTN